jgi:hypothetical protein
MKLLKYESFLETIQFAALTNAQRLAKQEQERTKQSTPKPSDDDEYQMKDVNQYDDDAQDSTEGDEEMEDSAEGDAQP